MGTDLSFKLSEHIDWTVPAGRIDDRDSSVLFAKIKDDAFLVMLHSRGVACFTPMLVVNPQSPITRGPLAKQFAGKVFGCAYDRVQNEVLLKLIAGSSFCRAKGIGPESIVPDMLPYKLDVTGNPEGGIAPSVLSMYGLPYWHEQLLAYHKLHIRDMDPKELLDRSMGPNLLVDMKSETGFDEESWVVCVTHNVRGSLIDFLQKAKITVRARKVFKGVPRETKDRESTPR